MPGFRLSHNNVSGTDGGEVTNSGSWCDHAVTQPKRQFPQNRAASDIDEGVQRATVADHGVVSDDRSTVKRDKLANRHVNGDSGIRQQQRAATESAAAASDASG